MTAYVETREAAVIIARTVRALRAAVPAEPADGLNVAELAYAVGYRGGVAYAASLAGLVTAESMAELLSANPYDAQPHDDNPVA